MRSYIIASSSGDVEVLIQRRFVAELAIAGCIVTTMLYCPDPNCPDPKIACLNSANELYHDLSFSHRMEGMKKVRRLYGRPWRTGIRNLLSEKAALGAGPVPTGPMEVQAINSHIAERLLVCYGRDDERGSSAD